MFRYDYFKGTNLPPAVKNLQKISQQLYDRLDITGAGKFTYFKGSQGRSRLYTNFDGQSQFDNPRAYLVMGLRAFPASGVAAADVNELANRAYFTLTIGDKPFFEAPLSLILTTLTALQTQGQMSTATLKLDNPILLPSQQIFKPAIDVESPVTLTGPVPLTLVFDGVLLRPAQ